MCVTCTPGTGLYNLLNKLGVASPINGSIYTIAGTGSATNSTLNPGLGNTVNMGPQKLFMDADNNLYIADSSNSVVWFEDSRSGYTRVIAGGGTSSSCNTSAIGDGCIGTAAIVGSNGGNGFGLTLDQQGNLYISDSTNLRIRKVSNNLRFGTAAVSTPVAQQIQLHFTPGDSPTATSLSSPDFSLSAGTCTINPVDNTDDCGYLATFNPAVAGARSAPLMVSTTLNNPAYLGFTGIGLGAGATLDPAAQFTFGQSLTVNALATDNTGNVYVADEVSKSVLKFAPGANGISAGSSAVFSNIGTFTNPSGLAVDSLGNIYVADSATGLITQISPSGTTKTLGTGFTSPQGLAVDALNNLYVSDTSAKTITEIGSNFVGSRIVANTNLAAPTGIAVDSSLNVYVADSAASSVYKYTSPGFAPSTVTSAASAPKSVAVDAAGNVLVADSASGNILGIPASANSGVFTVASGLAANALALDSIGNVYTASPSGQVLEFERTQGLTAFSRINNAPVTLNLLSTGNAAATLSLTNPDQTNFSLSLTASTDCAQSATISVVAGGVCQFTSQFTPTSATNFSNTTTFTGNASNAALASPPTLEIVQTGDNAPFPVTVTVEAFSPATPSFGQDVSLSASVTSTDGTPTGTVAFSVDGTSLAPVPLNNGSASATASTLSVGGHNVTATFISSDGSFATTTSSPASLTVGQALVTPLLSIQSTMPIYGAPNSATVTLASAVGTPTGTVQFTIDGSASGTPVTVSSGVAHYTLPTLSASPHLVAAIYSGDSDFSGTGVPGIAVTVAPATPTITWASPASIPYGTALSAVQLNATSSVPGTFVYTPTSGAVLLPGVQTLTTTFTPTDTTDYTTASGSVTLTVAPPTVTFTVSNTQQVYPTWANFVVSPQSTGNRVPTGKVTVLDGATPLVTLTLGGDGKAYWTTNPPLAAGTHTITVSYSGDRNYAPGISPPTTITVAPATVNMGVSCWGGSPFGINYTCQANLSSSAGSATGSISYTFDGGSPISIPINNGSAQFVILQPPAGSHQVVISYAGQGNYASVLPQTRNFTTQPGQTQLQLSPSSYYLQSGTSLTLTTAASTPQSGVPAGSVTFYDSGTSIGSAPTSSNGVTTLTIPNITKGQHRFSAIFTGTSNYSNATSGSANVTAY